MATRTIIQVVICQPDGFSTLISVNCPEFTALIPEVRVNLAYALPEAETSQDVAAVEGRITAVHGFPCASGMPTWGASDHLARRLLEVRKYDPKINAVINFKYNQEIIEVIQQYCSERSLLFGWLDRSQEPNEVIEHDGAFCQLRSAVHLNQTRFNPSAKIIYMVF
ncbi:MAG: thiamine-phosphate synthase family protein [Bacteroidales bacterium]|nr:thiamine-phosphate synthase family protein [Bacteroidales bacterium]